MNPTENGLTPAGAVAAPQPQPSQSGVDPGQLQAELDRIRGERDQLAAGLQQLRPYAEDIEWLTQNDDNAKFLRESRKAYEQARKSREQVPEELRPLEAKVDKLTTFVDEFQAASKRAAEEPRMRWLQEGKSFCEQLMKQYPDVLGRSADSTLSWTGSLQNICESRGLTWEEGWKEFQRIGSAASKVSGPMPTSSRADTGLAGLPPPIAQPTTTPSDHSGKLGPIVLERMRQMQT